MSRLDLAYFYCTSLKENSCSDVELTKHLFKVLRYRIGDSFVLYDGSLIKQVKVVNFTDKQFDFSLVKKLTKSIFPVTLIQGIPDSTKKIEFIVKYAFIAGYTNIIFTKMKRSSPLVPNLPRLLEIAQNALNLSRIPIKASIEVLDIKRINLDSYSSVFICDEESDNSPKTSLVPNSAIVIGPEGGLDDLDRKIFYRDNTYGISLGDSIYPTELASIIPITKLKN